MCVFRPFGDDQPGKSKGTADAAKEVFDRAVQAIANEISLLHKLSNAIRRASKESQNLKAPKGFQIRDDGGNDLEPMLEERFAHNIRDQFPDISDAIQKRLAATMVLRRKRILYRRSRYGKTPIRPKQTIPQPKVNIPAPRQQTAIPSEQILQLDGPESTAKPTQCIVRSLAISATALTANRFKKALEPSVVVSTVGTIPLGNRHDLIFPPAPRSYVIQKFKRLKKQRQEDHEAYLKALPHCPLYTQYNGQSPLHPSIFADVCQQISEAQETLRKTL